MLLKLEIDNPGEQNRAYGSAGEVGFCLDGQAYLIAKIFPLLIGRNLSSPESYGSAVFFRTPVSPKVDAVCRTAIEIALAVDLYNHIFF